MPSRSARTGVSARFAQHLSRPSSLYASAPRRAPPDAASGACWSRTFCRNRVYHRQTACLPLTGACAGERSGATPVDSSGSSMDRCAAAARKLRHLEWRPSAHLAGVRELMLGQPGRLVIRLVASCKITSELLFRARRRSASGRPRGKRCR